MYRGNGPRGPRGRRAGVRQVWPPSRRVALATEARALHDEEGLSYREIAERLGVSHESVRRWLTAPPAAAATETPDTENNQPQDRDEEDAPPSSSPLIGLPRTKGAQLHRGEMKHRAVELLTTQRASIRRVAAVLGVSHTTIERWADEYHDRLDEENRAHVGRHRARQTVELKYLMDAWYPRALAGEAAAANVVIRLMDRNARLNGLDVPAERLTPQEQVIRNFEAIQDQLSDDELRAIAAGKTPPWLRPLLPEPPEPPAVEVREVEQGGQVDDAEWSPVDPPDPVA